MTVEADKAKYYARIQIETSAKPRIICMLHDHCVKLMRQVSDANDYSEKAAIQAQNILAQLERSLKQEDNVSEGLFHLYDYCYCLLEKPDVQSAKKALAIMVTLRDTFEHLARNQVF